MDNGDGIKQVIILVGIVDWLRCMLDINLHSILNCEVLLLPSTSQMKKLRHTKLKHGPEVTTPGNGIRIQAQVHLTPKPMLQRLLKSLANLIFCDFFAY